jgi:hypothetical protein
MISKRFAPPIEKSLKRAPYQHPGDKQETYVVSGIALVPVECRMRVVAWNRCDAENEAAHVWHENFQRRRDWVVPGTVDDQHPEQWVGHAEVEEQGGEYIPGAP